jgi:hypothetical protein
MGSGNPIFLEGAKKWAINAIVWELEKITGCVCVRRSPLCVALIFQDRIAQLSHDKATAYPHQGHNYTPGFSSGGGLHFAPLQIVLKRTRTGDHIRIECSRMLYFFRMYILLNLLLYSNFIAEFRLNYRYDID